MNNRLKYLLFILLSIVLGSAHNFVINDFQADFFLLIDKEIWLSLVVFDIGMILNTSILTFLLIKLDRQFFTPLFIYTLLRIPFYFIDFEIYSSFWLGLFWILLTILYLKKVLK